MSRPDPHRRRLGCRFRWSVRPRAASSPASATRTPTVARIVKVTPSGGGAKWKVQPACRRSYRAGPAYTHGDMPPVPATGAQSWNARLQYSERKRMNMRWPDALPGMPGADAHRIGRRSGVADVDRGPQRRRARCPRDAVRRTGGHGLRLRQRDVRHLRGGILGDRGRRDDQHAGACEHGQGCGGAEHPEVYRVGHRAPPHVAVMNWTHVRSRDVNEAVAERMPVWAGTEVDTFAALYQRTFPRVFAYSNDYGSDRSACVADSRRACGSRRLSKAVRAPLGARVLGRHRRVVRRAAGAGARSFDSVRDRQRCIRVRHGLLQRVLARRRAAGSHRHRVGDRLGARLLRRAARARDRARRLRATRDPVVRLQQRRRRERACDELASRGLVSGVQLAVVFLGTRRPFAHFACRQRGLGHADSAQANVHASSGGTSKPGAS